MLFALIFPETALKVWEDTELKKILSFVVAGLAILWLVFQWMERCQSVLDSEKAEKEAEKAKERNIEMEQAYKDDKRRRQEQQRS